MFARCKVYLLAGAMCLVPVAWPQTASPEQGATVSPTHFKILTQDAITARLKQFSGSDRDREGRLKGWFLEAGCPAERLTEQSVASGVPPNLICTLPGETDSVILVSAHFDYVNRGEGVVDNWTGASLLPAFVSTLSQKPLHHTFVFINFTEEEHALRGSEFYAKHLSPTERQKIAAVINLDTLGLAPTEVWVSRADPQLTEILNAVAHEMQLPLRGVNVDRVGSTDSESFAAYKIPRMTIHSLTQDTIRVLHSPQDRFSAVHLDDYYASYRLLSAYLVYLDRYLGRHAPEATSPGQPQSPTHN